MENHIIKASFLLVCCLWCTSAIAQPQSNFYFEIPDRNSSFCAPLMVQFTNASTSANPNFSWKVNGQVFSEEEDPRWIFLEAGNYKICLEVKDTAGAHEACQTLQFFESKNIPLDVASLTPEL